MYFTNVQRLPIVMVSICLGNMVVGYVVSVGLGHVYPVFPYVSEIGNYPPESCLFSITTTMGAVLSVIFFWVIHQQNENHVRLCKQGLEITVLSINNIGFRFGISFAIAVFVAGNVQQSNGLVVHLSSAAVLLMSMVGIMATQAYISYKTNISPKSIAHRRLAQVIAQAILAAVGGISAVISFVLFTGSEVAKWCPQDGGHTFHAASAIAEWLLIINYCAFLYSYTEQFKHIAIRLPEVQLNASMDRRHSNSMLKNE